MKSCGESPGSATRTPSVVLFPLRKRYVTAVGEHRDHNVRTAVPPRLSPPRHVLGFAHTQRTPWEHTCCQLGTGQPLGYAISAAFGRHHRRCQSRMHGGLDPLDKGLMRPAQSINRCGIEAVVVNLANRCLQWGEVSANARPPRSVDLPGWRGGGLLIPSRGRLHPDLDRALMFGLWLLQRPGVRVMNRSGVVWQPAFSFIHAISACRTHKRDRSRSTGWSSSTESIMPRLWPRVSVAFILGCKDLP